MKRQRYHTTQLFILTALLSVALLTFVFSQDAFADLLTPESGGSSGADKTDSLFKIVLYIALAVFVSVEGALIYSIVKFRHRRGAEAARFSGNNKLEIGWTVGAALILVVLATLTFTRLDGISNPPGESLPEPERLAASPEGNQKTASQLKDVPGDRLTVEVSGRQYLWRFAYPDGTFSYHDLVVPVNTVVVLKVTAVDVAHSWWIPKLGGKRDAIPGYVQYTWFKSDQPGEFDGQCAELCGSNHANMTARVRVVEKPEYEQWLARTKHDIAMAGQELDRLKPKFDQLQAGASTGQGGAHQ